MTARASGGQLLFFFLCRLKSSEKLLCCSHGRGAAGRREIKRETLLGAQTHIVAGMREKDGM